MKVVTDLSMLKVHGRDGDGGGEADSLLHTNADTAILVEAIKNITLLTWHDLVEGGGVSLSVDDANCLFHVCVYDDHLTWVKEEELMAGGTGKAHLQAIIQGHRLLTPRGTENNTSHAMGC